ncbi:hypothetical protein RDWZM_010579 [Blomia tropicalis]|uniref:Secreted protein n=1 Tax=Blomia tropicalis TaxID=40697 RepID=A0A9Q0LZD0_BLOTA|nr:hypothetical protein RDWZM_010579 [Blomia tropicalis]
MYLKFQLIVVSLALFVYLDSVSAIGRNPTSVEHNACRMKWAEQVNEKGLDGLPCMTSCRITFRGNNKEMDDIFTPDDVQCSSGPFPRFCMKGRCVLPAKFRSGANNGDESAPSEVSY